MPAGRPAVEHLHGCSRCRSESGSIGFAVISCADDPREVRGRCMARRWRSPSEPNATRVGEVPDLTAQRSPSRSPCRSLSRLNALKGSWSVRTGPLVCMVLGRRRRQGRVIAIYLRNQHACFAAPTPPKGGAAAHVRSPQKRKQHRHCRWGDAGAVSVGWRLSPAIPRARQVFRIGDSWIGPALCGYSARRASRQTSSLIRSPANCRRSRVSSCSIPGGAKRFPWLRAARSRFVP
jgi:hypothetical protein